jgi:hypothetical protein
MVADEELKELVACLAINNRGQSRLNTLEKRI